MRLIMILGGMILGLSGCSDIPAELAGSWSLDVKRSIEYSGLSGALSAKGRNAWTQELDESTTGVNYTFSGSTYQVSHDQGSQDGRVALVREKEGRFTLELRKGDDVDRVRVWFDDQEMFMEQHHQTMVFKRK